MTELFLAGIYIVGVHYNASDDAVGRLMTEVDAHVAATNHLAVIAVAVLVGVAEECAQVAVLWSELYIRPVASHMDRNVVGSAPTRVGQRVGSHPASRVVQFHLLIRSEHCRSHVNPIRRILLLYPCSEVVDSHLPVRVPPLAQVEPSESCAVLGHDVAHVLVTYRVAESFQHTVLAITPNPRHHVVAAYL